MESTYKIVKRESILFNALIVVGAPTKPHQTGSVFFDLRLIRKSSGFSCDKQGSTGKGVCRCRNLLWRCCRIMAMPDSYSDMLRDVEGK